MLNDQMHIFFPCHAVVSVHVVVYIIASFQFPFFFLPSDPYLGKYLHAVLDICKHVPTYLLGLLSNRAKNEFIKTTVVRPTTNVF